MRVAKLVSKILHAYVDETAKQEDAASSDEDQMDLPSMLKVYKSNLKFVQKNISDPRVKVSELIDKQADKKVTQDQTALLT